jgi:hypothetical protein
MTALSVALGVDIASGLLQEAGSHGSSHALHAGAFLLAAPAAPAGVTFFIAVAVASFAMGAFPRPLGGWQ